MGSIKRDKPFNAEEVYSVAGGHLLHDLHTSFLAPLLPEIIHKLSLSLTSAGALTTLIRIPAILNPLLGYVSDKTSARYFVIFAPALTSTFMSMLGLAPSPWVLGVLLLLAGFSSSLFHAPSPAIIGVSSKKRVGFGMSLYMAGGGLGRTLGPLLVVWAVGVWGLEGTYRLMLIGWAASLILFFQLKKIDIHPQKASSFSLDFHKFKSFFLPLSLILVLRNFLLASISTYLPTYLRQNGSPLWIAGASLSALEVSGVFGALLLGSLSDVIGRKKILIPAMLISSLTLFGFLNTSGWKMIPFLIILGMSSKSTGTIFLALVQDQFKIHRATGNGIYMLISFLTNAGMLLLIGIIGDAFGLRFAYYIAIITSLCTMPALLLLPESKLKPDVKTSN